MEARLVLRYFLFAYNFSRPDLDNAVAAVIASELPASAVANMSAVEPVVHSLEGKKSLVSTAKVRAVTDSG